MATATILADASFCPRTRAAGWGYWIASDRGKRGGGGELRRMRVGETSKHAEMMALVNALKVARAAGLVLDGDEILFQTDCIEAITCFRAKRPKRITDVMDQLTATLDVTYKHVKGHTSRVTHTAARFGANRACDERARHYMLQARARADGHPFGTELVPLADA